MNESITPENFFEHLESCTLQEKELIAELLISTYKSAVKDQRECYYEYTENRQSKDKEIKYFESVQRLGAIIDVFGMLGVQAESISE